MVAASALWVEGVDLVVLLAEDQGVVGVGGVALHAVNEDFDGGTDVFVLCWVLMPYSSPCFTRSFAGVQVAGPSVSFGASVPFFALKAVS